MFDFLRKAELWDALGAGLQKEVASNMSYELKIAQELAIYGRLRDLRDQVIGEISGGTSRVLAEIAKTNTCFNIEKSEGADNGPERPVARTKVRDLMAFVGTFEPVLEGDFFDVVFSISVIEHVPMERLDLFHQDQLRVLKPGGVFLHAIDVYVSEAPTDYWLERYDAYRSWVADDPDVTPLGPVREGPFAFSCDMVSNPDNVMHGWGALSPELTPLRQVAQNVSLIVGGRKAG